MRLVLVLVLAATAVVRADEPARAILDRGIAHEDAGRPTEAARDYELARAAAEREGDPATLTDSLIHIGYLEYYRGEINQSLVNLQRAYALARESGDAKAQRGALETIAHIYADTKVGQYDRAIEYYRQLLPQYQAEAGGGTSADIADTLYNLGSTYERKEDLQSALDWYRRALAEEEKLGRADEAAMVKRSIGATLGKLGRPAEALPFLDDALRVFTAQDMPEQAVVVRQSRGIVHRRAGNVSAAIADLEATRAWFAKQKNTRYLEKTEEELALVYAAAGRWHDAYDARTRHAALQRELAEKLREEHTSRLRVQFDSERKEQENRSLLRDKAAAERIRALQTVILLLGAAIIGVLAYLMVRLARDKRRMRDMAMTDELTRLPNRRHLLAAAEEQLDRARIAREPLSLIAFDIDHFKRINDTWGHAAGDKVLQRVAHACRGAIRPGDQIGRTGGEEFLVVLPNTAEHAARSVAERLRTAVETIDVADIDPSLRVTISLGVATRSAEESLERLTAAADALLYRAKESGRNRVVATMLALLLLTALPLAAATPYAIGNPVVVDVWVDPANGNDANGGTAQSDALRTLAEAWERIPRAQTLEHGYRIQLAAGTYTRDAIPHYLESRWGTAQHPIIIQSAGAPRSARLLGDLNVFDTRYFYLIGLDIRPEPASDVFHCERCDHVLIRDCNLEGGAGREAFETFKANQSSHIYIEDSAISGAADNAVDFVGVQYGHVINSSISDAADWCIYTKGGSAYFAIEGNEIFDCGTGGFTAGQGAGFQFMVSPWLHYEAYDIKVVNNVIHHTEGAGLGVNGGYNILLAHNTLYRVGERSHMLEVVFGGRSCDGGPENPERARCAEYLAAGGWGTTSVDTGDNFVRIPNRNVAIYNNVLYNPRGHVAPQIFSIHGPWTDASTQNGSNVPARTDDGLVIRGNVIFSEGAELGIGDGSGCAPEHPTCNAAQLVADNSINVFEPQLVNPEAGDFRPVARGNVATARTFAIPPFTWADAPTRPAPPPGTLANEVTFDRAGRLRATPSTAGAYADAPPRRKRRAVR